MMQAVQNLAASFAYAYRTINPRYQAISVVSILDKRGILARHVAHGIMVQQARSLWFHDPVLPQRTSNKARWVVNAGVPGSLKYLFLEDLDDLLFAVA